MSTVVLRCPHCGFSKDAPPGVRPAPGVVITCPRCKGKFSFSEETSRAKREESSSAPLLVPDQPASGPSVVPQPEPKSVECDLCNVKLGLDEAVPYEELEGIYFCRSCYGKVTAAGHTEISAAAPATEKKPSTPSPEGPEAPTSASPKPSKKPVKRGPKCYWALLLLVSCFGLLYLIRCSQLWTGWQMPLFYLAQYAPIHRISWEEALFIPIGVILGVIIVIIAFNSHCITSTAKKHRNVIAFIIALGLISILRNSRQYSYLMMMFTPSFAGVMIAILCSSRIKLTLKFALLFSALLLHGISAFLLKVAVGVGEAWSGYSSSHYLPINFFIWGCLAIVFISFVRSKPMRAIADFFDAQWGKWTSMLLERWSWGHSVAGKTRQVCCAVSGKASTAWELFSKVFGRFKVVIIAYLIISCFLSGWFATRKVMSIGIREGATMVGAASLISDSEILVVFNSRARGAHGFSTTESDRESTLWHPSSPTISFNTRFDNLTSKPVHLGPDDSPAPHYACADTANVGIDLVRDNGRLKTFFTSHFRSDSRKPFIVEEDKYDKLCAGVDLLVVNDYSRAAKLYVKTKHFTGRTCYDCFTVPYPEQSRHKVLPTIFKFFIVPFAVIFDALTGLIQFILMFMSL